jgi:hypothetical protein
VIRILLWAMACRASIKVRSLELARKVVEEYFTKQGQAESRGGGQGSVSRKNRDKHPQTFIVPHSTVKSRV